MFVKVKNLNKTSDLKCTCPKSESWLDHWNLLSNRTAECCAVCGSRREIVGAHVKKVGKDMTRFIVPLCNQCNTRKDEFEVACDMLVSATCKKPSSLDILGAALVGVQKKSSP